MKKLPTTSAVLVLLALTAGAQATLRVPEDYSSITSAVAAASNGDMILVGPGTYTEGAVVSFAGKIIEVRSTDGPTLTIIDGEGEDRCVRFTGGETRDTLLEGFTLRNGQAPTGTGTNGRDGGAILIQHASPTIRNCIVRDSDADYGANGGSPGYRGGHGGGMHINTGSPWVEGCTFLFNNAGRGGRGATGSTGSTGNLFNAPGSGGAGGAGGTGGHGGAVHLNTGAPVFVNCFFAHNQTGLGGEGGDGGRGGNAGTWVGRGGAGGSGGAGGYGGSGGALYVTAGTPAILNCTVVGNHVRQGSAGGDGGNGGSSSLGSGSSGSGGGGGDYGSWNGIYTNGSEVHNSILANSGEEISPGNTVTYSCVLGGYSGAGNISAPPNVNTFVGDLSPESPCIDAGDNGQFPSASSVDLRGNPRFFDDPGTVDVGLGAGALVDMGAVEFARDYILPHGCGNPAGSLTVVHGAPRIGDVLRLRLDRPDAPQQTGGDVLFPALAARAGLIIGLAPLDNGCGVQLPGGYLQVDLARFWFMSWSDQLWNGAPVDASISFPADSSLIGTSLFVQGAFVRLSPRGGLGAGMRLTDSLELVVGP